MRRGPPGKLKQAAAAAYTRIPGDDELRSSGLTRDDYVQHAEVWPENWPAWCLFAELSTQWRTAGMAGARVGLDYGPLFARLDRIAADRDEWEQLFQDVRVLEAAALDQMSQPA